MKSRIKRAIKILYDIFPVMNRPLALCAAVCALAVVFLFYHRENSLSLLILFVIVAAVICRFYKSKKLIVVSLIFLAICASTVNELYTIGDLESLDGQTVNADLIAVEDSNFNGAGNYLTVYCYNSDTIPKNTKLQIYYYFSKEIKCGEKFNADFKISKLNDGPFKLSHIGDSIYVDCRLLSINSNYKESAFFTAIGEIRQYFNYTLKKRFSGDISPTLLALNCGNRDYLSDEFYDKVRVCGVSHVMVVSGLHLSIILGLFFRFIERFIYSRSLKAGLSLAAIFFLCALFGFTQSIIRAGCMFVFSAFSPLFMRKNDMLNSLGAAILIMIYFNPFCVFSVAFLLSVSSTVAVVWLSPFYIELFITKLNIKTRIGKAITEILIISIMALIFTAPVSMWVFGKTSLVAPFAFLLITFPVTVALIFNSAGLVLAALGGISFLSVPFFIISGLCAKYINFIINNLGLLDMFYVDLGIPGFVGAIFLIFALISTMYFYKFYQKLKKRQYILEVKRYAGNLRKPTEKPVESR
ncbi:MAG: ComEC/Rec2 family competence protein [Clostridia bacterium]|nr:ComEC/Rec2 family competence protein [Clostridia bacterium]